MISTSLAVETEGCWDLSCIACLAQCKGIVELNSLQNPKFLDTVSAG